MSLEPLDPRLHAFLAPRLDCRDAHAVVIQHRLQRLGEQIVDVDAIARKGQRSRFQTPFDRRFVVFFLRHLSAIVILNSGHRRAIHRQRHGMTEQR